MNHQPVVSILMTAYNRENYIAEAIESVLASTYTNFELLISDDASTDNTLAIAQMYERKDSRIKVYENKINKGDYPNRNIVASYAKGKYIKYIDSDDIIFSNGLKKMVESMELFPEAAFGISQFVFDKSIAYPQLISPEQAYKQHYYGYELLRYGPVGVIINREIFMKENGFNKDRYISDTELWLRLSAIYPIVKIEPDVVFWRKHGKQEFNYGMNNFSYLRLAYPVYMKSLQSKNCPLNGEDILAIKHRLQWKHARDIISLAFKTLHPAYAYLIYRESGINFIQLLKGFFPFKKYKNKC